MFGLKTTVFCGPMKSGTTWVHAYLKAREDVCLPARTKEIFFFDRYYHRGLKWYKGQFRPESQNRILVDVAPSILAHPEAPARVAATLPEANVVVMRRDPVARAWSHYLHLKRYGYTAAPLDKAIETHPVIIEASRADFWLDRWRAEIGPDRASLLDADLLGRDTQGFVQELNRLLGLPQSTVETADIGRVNGAAAPRHHLLSAFARRVSYALRDVGLDGVVQAARDLGLNKIYARRAPNQSLTASDAERELIMHKLMEGPRPV